jgi:hypothetical protein
VWPFKSGAKNPANSVKPATLSAALAGLTSGVTSVAGGDVTSPLDNVKYHNTTMKLVTYHAISSNLQNGNLGIDFHGSNVAFIGPPDGAGNMDPTKISAMVYVTQTQPRITNFTNASGNWVSSNDKDYAMVQGLDVVNQWKKKTTIPWTDSAGNDHQFTGNVLGIPLIAHAYWQVIRGWNSCDTDCSADFTIGAEGGVTLKSVECNYAP